MLSGATIHRGRPCEVEQQVSIPGSDSFDSPNGGGVDDGHSEITANSAFCAFCAVFGMIRSNVKNLTRAASIVVAVVKVTPLCNLNRIGSQARRQRFPRLAQVPGTIDPSPFKPRQAFENVGIKHRINSPRRGAGRVQMRVVLAASRR